MGEYERIQQEIYAIVMDGADAPRPDEGDYAVMLLWYEMKFSILLAEREEYKNMIKKQGEY